MLNNKKTNLGEQTTMKYVCKFRSSTVCFFLQLQNPTVNNSIFPMVSNDNKNKRDESHFAEETNMIVVFCNYGIHGHLEICTDISFRATEFVLETQAVAMLLNRINNRTG